MRKAKSKSGFSMMEVVIALAVITVVTLASLTTIMASISARVKIVNRSEAQNFAQNVWECFKVSDSVDSFEENVKFAEGVDLNDLDTENEKIGVYNYNVGNQFTVSITVDFTTSSIDNDKTVNIKIDVIDNKNEEIVSFDYDKYVSQEGGA